ncbi:MAG: ABC transporter permease [Sphingobacteriia bacterium]
MSRLLFNLHEALAALRRQRLRAGLTLLIIGFGVMAIVGVLTSIDSVKYYLMSSFSTLGANTFRVQNREGRIRMRGRGQQADFPAITYREARAFQQRMQGVAVVSLSYPTAMPVRVRYRQHTTNPNVFVQGADPAFLQVQTYQLALGRFITPEDLAEHRAVAVLGWAVYQRLFGTGSGGLGQAVQVGSHQYRVVGVFAEKGSGFGSQGDKVAVIPLSTALAHYPGQSTEVSVYVPSAPQLAAVAEAARGHMRRVRRLHPTREDNFAIVKSDAFIDSLLRNLRILTWSATAIAVITLLGAGVGLMNIMLVSVSDRTMEIGLRKSLGATRAAIRQQFLTEAVVICQLGGLVGIGLGLGMAALVGMAMGTAFVLPWGWILLSIGLCLLVGILSGYYPARRAARLDPIEALRQGS